MDPRPRLRGGRLCAGMTKAGGSDAGSPSDAANSPGPRAQRSGVRLRMIGPRPIINAPNSPGPRAQRSGVRLRMIGPRPIINAQAHPAPCSTTALRSLLTASSASLCSSGYSCGLTTNCVSCRRLSTLSTPSA